MSAEKFTPGQWSVPNKGKLKWQVRWDVLQVRDLRDKGVKLHQRDGKDVRFVLP